MKFVLIFVFALSLKFSNSVPAPSAYIVGGQPADIADFPYALALLDMIHGGASGYFCGASNIHRLWALSAAHCLELNTPAAFIHLYGGSTSRSSGGHLFFVQQYILHPNYNRRILDHDVALLEMNENYPLEGFEFVQPIPLPPACSSACCGVCPDGPNVVVAGWGSTETGQFPENLRYVTKGVMAHQECLTFWIRITSRMFCTIVENGKDSCNGDSGSAVVRNGVQVGIVSFGSDVCGDGSRPAVYVRLEEPVVRNFISQVAGI